MFLNQIDFEPQTSMCSNSNVSITAELMALVRYESASDYYGKYFVTPRAQKLYACFQHVVPAKTLTRMFQRRLQLSRELHHIIEAYKPEQIIEFGGGYSTFGLTYSQKHRDVLYIDTDLPEITKRKADTLRTLLQVPATSGKSNYVLAPVDVLSNDIYESIEQHINKHKKTLLLAEGLTSYFRKSTYDKYVDNVVRCAHQIDRCAYLSHETLSRRWTSGIAERLLRSVVTILSRSKFNQHFASLKELRSYYESRGFLISDEFSKKIHTNIIYLATMGKQIG